MAPTTLQKELDYTARMLSWWRAELKFALWASIVMVCLWLFSLSDVYIQFERLGRIATWSVLIALIGAMFRQVSKTLFRKYTIQGVAASVEKSFPQLDNHLINYLQFSADKTKDPFKAAYVKPGIPEWKKINVREMKNRKAHKRAMVVLAVAIALLVVPCTIRGRMWTVALWRIVNPFSNCQPITLTRILDVDPGDTSVTLGTPLVMQCKIQGKKGHCVWLDIKPSDDKKTTYLIGKIASKTAENFSYRIAEITTDLKYRFRAGDASLPKWYNVEARPPLAFTKIDLNVKPPEYTSVPPQTFDGIGGDVRIPQGSKVDVTVRCNLPLSAVSIMTLGGEPMDLTRFPEEDTWKGTATIETGNSMKLVAINAYKESAETTVNFSFVPDKAPVIQILAPKGHTMLPPGNVPHIEFAALDDYSLAEITVERVALGSPQEAAGKVVKSWKITDRKDFAGIWEGKEQRPKNNEALAFRVVAKDNCPFGQRLSKSSTIIFNSAGFAQAAQKKESLETQASSTLSKIIDLQRENIDNTGKLRKAVDLTKPEQWDQTAEQQRTIRQLTGKLLRNPLKPLGGLTTTVKKLYMNEMEEVISHLTRIPVEGKSGKIALIDRALSLEQTILRKLTSAELAARQIEIKRRISGLLAMINALVDGETGVLKATMDYAQKSLAVGDTLVDKQDGLATDVTEFINACRRESEAIKANDKNFSDLVQKVAGDCEDQEIRNDMLLASEQLDKGKPHSAVPHEKQALAKLRALQEKLSVWQMANAEEKMEEMLEALRAANEKMKKLHKLQTKAIESIAEVKPTLNKDTKEEDLLEEEFNELMKITKDALLQIPVDLQIFMELNVANELVEDVFSIFEEVVQEEGTEKTEAEDATVKAVPKLEFLLEMMESATGRMDDMEQWLGNAPDAIKVVDEAFDQEEMPEAGMALAALATEAEDIIGDLLKQEEAEGVDTEDGAVNQAITDDEYGTEVGEGDEAGFSAKGKSGNEVPDHKEQDGRSNVGRQGMAVGETAAGSGTINEGDPNIEKRRTQDPTQSGQVDLDGEADTKGTGGGKQATGKADEFGMHGGTHRMDSTAPGSMDGMESMMAARAEAMYAKASLLNLRTSSLSDAAHHMRQAADAIADGLPISQIKEHRKNAIACMRRAKTELGSGVSVPMDDDGLQTAGLEDVVEGGTDQAPAEYRELVAEYYKSLNESL